MSALSRVHRPVRPSSPISVSDELRAWIGARVADQRRGPAIRPLPSRTEACKVLTFPDAGGRA